MTTTCDGHLRVGKVCDGHLRVGMVLNSLDSGCVRTKFQNNHNLLDPPCTFTTFYTALSCIILLLVHGNTSLLKAKWTKTNPGMLGFGEERCGGGINRHFPLLY